MKSRIFVILSLLLLAAPAMAADADANTRHVVVTLVEFDGSVSNGIMAEADYKDLAKDVQVEGPLITLAHRNARILWPEVVEEDIDGNKPKFPLRRPSPRRLSQRGIFATSEKAERKLWEVEKQGEIQKQMQEANETAQRARMSSKKRRAVDKKADLLAEALQLFRDELDGLKMDVALGLPPQRIEKYEDADAATSRRKRRVRQGKRLGENAGSIIKNTGSIVKNKDGLTGTVKLKSHRLGEPRETVRDKTPSASP